MTQAIWSLSFLACLVSFPLSTPGFASPRLDESPLDEVISPASRARIDARKAEQPSEDAARDPLRDFGGPREVDLRFRDTPVKQQFPAKKCAGFRNKVGTCSAFGLTAAVENAFGGYHDLSERQLWSQYCVPSSEAAIRALSRGKGMIEESYWPQGSKRPVIDPRNATRFRMLEFSSLGDNALAMILALQHGSPLYLALNTPADMWARKKVIEAGSGDTGGGHAVAVVGYRLDDSVEGGGYLLIKNSWGESNGDHGYQWLSLGYCARKGNYCEAWSVDKVKGF